MAELEWWQHYVITNILRAILHQYSFVKKLQSPTVIKEKV